MEAAGCVAAANDVSNTQQAKESQLALGGGRGPSSSWWPRTFFFANRGSQSTISSICFCYSLLRIFFFSFFSSKTYDKIKSINKNELLGIFFLFSSHILGFGSSFVIKNIKISPLGIQLFGYYPTTSLNVPVILKS